MRIFITIKQINVKFCKERRHSFASGSQNIDLTYAYVCLTTHKHNIHSLGVLGKFNCLPPVH